MTVQFRGGPLDGQEMDMQEPPAEFYVPIPLSPGIADPEPDVTRAPPMLVHCYRLRPANHKRFRVAYKYEGQRRA